MPKRKRKTRTRQTKAQKITSLILGAIILVCAAFFTIKPATKQNISANAPSAYSSAVHFIDVGQGDSVLIEQNGEFALIDAGETSAKAAVVNYLKSANVTALKYLIMTHPHSDHIGGMQEVFENFEVQNFVLPDLDKAPTPTSKVFENVIDTAIQKQIPTITAEIGVQYALGDGLITVLGTGVAGDDLNNISTAIKFSSGDFTFLDTGDAEGIVEMQLINSGADLDADLFKAGHHGSSTSNTKTFLNKVSPQSVVISCGKDNKYGHPHKEALSAFKNSNCAVYRTDELGNIVCYTTNDGNIITTQKR